MSATKLWLDGCFDGFHFAHANAIRQATTLVPGPVEVVVGVHSDAEITRIKGPPLFEEQERYALVAGCRWVSRLVEDVPYVTQPDVFDKYSVDIIVHGDDPAMDAEGNDCYALPKALGRYKEYKRTEGISTTSMIDRLLDRDAPSDLDTNQKPLRDLLDKFSNSCDPPLPLIDFSAGEEISTGLFKPDVRDVQTVLVYIGGDWDCFCSAHVQFLREAKEFVSQKSVDNERQVRVKLVVGISSDEDVTNDTGEKPLLSLYERALAVAQCQYTDALVVGVRKDHSSDELVRLGIEMIALMPGQSRSGSDHETIEHVELPKRDGRPVYTVRHLRERLAKDLAAYEERQRRKGR